LRVVIAGGSGFIGRQLSAGLVAEGHQVVVLSRGAMRSPEPGVEVVPWDARSISDDWMRPLRGAEAVVNLAGASIGSGRWTRRRKAEILSSRVDATAAIVQALGQMPAAERPGALINASGIDFYGDRGDEPITEDSAAGHSFLAGVCQQWEAAAKQAEPLGVRVVLVRTALVLGRGAPAFRLMVLPFRLYAGGPLGNGRQWFTWIQIDDLVGIYRLALENGALRGALNAVAPDVRRQREVAREIGRVMRRPAVMPAPAPLLRLALGDQSELLLHGRRALPQKVEQLGYRFRFPGLREALTSTL
jgi:uncharacterized protein (TIGR01777 family)